MAELRWRLLCLIAWLCLFFNIERLDIDGIDIINLPTYVYPIGFAAVLLPLILDVRRFSTVIVASPIMLLFLGGVAFNPIAALNGGGIYITFGSLCLLVGTTVLSRLVAESLSEFVQAVETVTLSDRNGVLIDIDQAKDQIENEMLRSRRTQRPLSLIIIDANLENLKTAPQRLIQDIQRKMAERYLLAITARMLARNLRRTDLLIETGKPGHIVLIAPETTSEAAESLGERIEQQVHDQFGISTRHAVATFPGRDLTFESLLASAEEMLTTVPTYGENRPLPATLLEVTLGETIDRTVEAVPLNGSHLSHK